MGVFFVANYFLIFNSSFVSKCYCDKYANRECSINAQ